MPKSAATASRRLRTLQFAAGAVLVALLVALAHWPALSARGLCFDDQQYLIHNDLVQHPSWTSARRFLTEVLEPSSVGGYYQPLAMISLMLDVAGGGGPDNLRPFHRTSLALHVLNTILVMALLDLLFGSLWVAAFVALLFGLHPLTVEPIPWIGERKTLLAAGFALAALATYVSYTKTLDWKRGLGALALFALALLSKPTSTPLPLLMLVLDWWPLRRLNRRALLEKAPLLLLAAASAVVTFESQRRTGITVLPTDSPAMRGPLLLCHNVIFYLRKIVWPTTLSPHYPFPEPLTLANPTIAAGMIATGVLVLALLLSLRWTRALAGGGLFFFVALFPTMGVIQFTNVIAADKFAYLPAVGLLLIVTWLLTRAWDVGAGETPQRRIAVVAVVVVLAATETHATRRQLEYWQTSDTLTQHIIALAPQSAKAHHLRAEALVADGDLTGAIGEFSEAVRWWPDFAEAYHNRGAAFAQQGQLDQAIADYTEALRLYPAPSADALYDLGTALARQGKLDDAIGEFEAALRVNPELAQAHYNLAVALAQRGDLGPSVTHFEAALRLNPGWTEARKNLDVVRDLQRSGAAGQ